ARARPRARSEAACSDRRRDGHRSACAARRRRMTALRRSGGVMKGALLASAAKIAISVLVLAIIGNPILLYFIQDRMIFHPVPINEGNRKLIKERYASVREVTVVSSDGTKLQGWFQRTRKAAKAPLLIYFGGNEEDVSYLPARDDRIEGWSLL